MLNRLFIVTDTATLLRLESARGTITHIEIDMGTPLEQSAMKVAGKFIVIGSGT